MYYLINEMYCQYLSLHHYSDKSFQKLHIGKLVFYHISEIAEMLIFLN